MGKLANLNLSVKAVLVAIVAVATAGVTTGVGLAAASSSNGNGNVGTSNGAPVQPVIGTSNLPSSPTNARTASFTYTDSRPAVSFLCSLDTAVFTSCPTSGMSYSNLGNATHTFRVEAQNGNGPLSTAASFSWTVANQPFPVSGNLTTPLAPGMPAQSLNLSITNPYSFTMKVTAVSVTVSATSDNANCPASGNFKTTNYTGPGFIVRVGPPVTMTAAGVLPNQLPTVQMVDLPKQSQDGCKNVTLTLTYGGSVTTP